MRKLVRAFIVICSSAFGFLNAQITISSSSMPASGDTIRYATASPAKIGTTWMARGGSQSWDFSKLTATGQGLYEYKSANKTPYAFYFFGQIGQKTADSLGGGPILFKNIYSFYTKSTSVFKTEGLGYSYSGIPLASKYTDEDEIYQFPLQYNDSDVSTFRFVFSIPGQSLFSFVQAGKRTNVVDAWGSIKTPYKTYSDVIRVMTFIDEVDTLVTQFTKFPIERKQVSYKFLATSEKIPVLEVVGTLSAKGVFTPTIINYRDKFTSTPGGNSGLAADFTVDRDTGTVNVDTFNFTNLTQPFAFTNAWKFTPAAGVRYVKGTSSSSANPSVVFANGGLYSVNLKATSGPLTGDTTINDMIFIGWGVGNKVIQRQFKVYPNPAKSKVYFEGHASVENIQILDVLGKVVSKEQFSYVVNNNVLQIDIASLPDGVYFVDVNNSVYRIIKQQ
jgi:hypothetical protein